IVSKCSPQTQACMWMRRGCLPFVVIVISATIARRVQPRNSAAYQYIEISVQAPGSTQAIDQGYIERDSIRKLVLMEISELGSDAELIEPLLEQTKLCTDSSLGIGWSWGKTQGLKSHARIERPSCRRSCIERGHRSVRVR